jgi:hypothetical protein
MRAGVLVGEEEEEHGWLIAICLECKRCFTTSE